MQRTFLSLVAALLVFFAPLTAIAENGTTPRFTDPGRKTRLARAFPEIEKIFASYQKRVGAPGLVFGVVIDGELALVKSMGVREVASKDPVTPDTLFRIASMTKSFTALAILKLRDEGKLSLDDPVSKYIPEVGRLKFPTADTAPIRVRQLLTHGAGFPEDNPWGDRQLAQSEAVLTRWLQAGIPFSTPPDTEYEYSNYGFALLGRIVSKASGRDYREYLEKEVLAALGMKASTLEPSAAPASLRAIGYRRSGDSYTEVPPLAHGTFGAMGGLLTSANDLARYVAFHLAAFPPRDDPDRGPVRRSSVREMQRLWRLTGMSAGRPSPDAPLRATASGYGYGLGVSHDCRFEHIVGHGGGLPGFGSYMLWLPDYGVGVFAMANVTYAGPRSAADDALDAMRATGALRPRELPPAPVLTETRNSIVRLWRQWDDRDAEKLAADNLFQDDPAGVRRKEMERVKSEVGECRDIGAVEPENLLRGKFRMECERGFVDVTFTLAPTLPPLVQHLRFAAVRPLEPSASAAARALAAAVASPDVERLSAIVAPSFDTARLRAQLDVLRVTNGACRVGETLGGNGKTSVQVRFDCDRAPLDARLQLDAAGKLTEANFSRASGASCAP